MPILIRIQNVANWLSFGIMRTFLHLRISGNTAVFTLFVIVATGLPLPLKFVLLNLKKTKIRTCVLPLWQL